MSYLVSALIAATVSIGIVLGLAQQKHQPDPVVSPAVQKAIQEYVDASLKEPIFGSTLPIAGQNYTLSGAGTSKTATSITLSSLTVTQTGQKIQDSDLSDTFYITLEPGNSTRQEIVSCTTVTQNAAGSATLSGCARGLSPITPYAASSTLGFSHGGGTQVIFSNPPQFYLEFLRLQNAATSSAVLTFASTSPPRYDNVGAQASGTYIATTSEFASVLYVNNIVVAGAPNSTQVVKGIVQLATALQAASSTILGTTGANDVLWGKYATDTPQNCSTPSNGGCVVMSLLNGKLNQSWLDLTQNFTFTGALNLAASAAKTLTLNSIAYVFPPTQSASSTVLSTDGSGNLSWEALQVGTLDVAGSTFTAPQTGASTTARFITIPANTLASTTAIRVRAQGLLTCSSGPTAVEVVFGNGTSSSSPIYVNSCSWPGSSSSNFSIETTIYTVNSASQSVVSTVSTTSPFVQQIATTFSSAVPLYIRVDSAAGASSVAKFYGITMETLTH